MKQILHLTDFSDNARKALRYAYYLSQKLNVPLRVINIAEAPTMLNTPHAFTFEEMDNQKKASTIDHLKNYCDAELGPISTLSTVNFSSVINNSTVEGTLASIKENDASLVVVGAKGKSRLREVIMGSTTRKLIEKSTIPVLIIPEYVVFSEIRKIIYASDFDRHDSNLLKMLSEFASKMMASITVLHIFPTVANYKTGISSLKEDLNGYAPLRYESRVSENTGEAIAEYLQQYEADLLVMYEKEKTGLIDQLFHADIIKRFVAHLNIPLLVFNTLNSNVEL